MTGSWGATIAGGLSLRMLAARFPRFTFGTRRMHNHVAFEAVRCDKGTPGVTVVITKDMNELRQALEDDLSGEDPDG